MLGLAAGTLRFEIQVETPQAILGPDGTALVARMVHAGGGRVHRAALRHLRLLRVAAGSPPQYQSMEHPVADHAKAVMQVAAAGTGVRLSDGSTNVLPVGEPRRGARRLGACTTGSSAAPSSAATTRAGTCTLPSCPPATPRCTPSTATAWPRPPTGCAATSSAPTPASSTSRRPRGRWPTSSCAGSTAGRSGAAEAQALSGVDAAGLAVLARRVAG